MAWRFGIMVIISKQLFLGIIKHIRLMVVIIKHIRLMVIQQQLIKLMELIQRQQLIFQLVGGQLIFRRLNIQLFLKLCFMEHSQHIYRYRHKGYFP